MSSKSKNNIVNTTSITSTIPQNPLEIKNHKDLEQAAKLLTIPRSERNPQQNNLLNEIMSKVSCLENLSNASDGFEESIDKCCSVMKLENYKNHELIFHYGDIGRKFYIILKGKVYIYIPKATSELKEELDKLEKEVIKLKITGTSDFLEAIAKAKQELLNCKQITQLNRLLTHEANPEFELNTEPSRIEINPDAKKKLIRQKSHTTIASSWHKIGNFNLCDREALGIFSKLPNYIKYIESGIFKFKKIRQLGPGDSFGELALITNQSRTGTAIAIGDIQVVSMSKQDYRTIFEAKIDKIYAKYNFFINLFSNGTPESISRFVYYFQEKKFDYGQKLYSQGEDPQELFVIIKGEVQLMIQAEKSIKQKKIDNADQFPDYEASKQTKLALLGPGAFVGEEEIFNNQKRIATAISVSGDTIVYSLNIEEFKNLRNRNSELLKNLIDLLETKSAFHKDRLNEIQNLKESILNSYTKTIDTVNEPKTALKDLLNNSMKNPSNNPLYITPRLQDKNLSYDDTFSQQSPLLGLENHQSQKTEIPLMTIPAYQGSMNMNNGDYNEAGMKSLSNLLKISQEFHQKYSIRNLNPDHISDTPAHFALDRKELYCSQPYISSKVTSDYEQSNNQDPLDILESKMKLVNSHENYFVPFDIQAPLFSNELNNENNQNDSENNNNKANNQSVNSNSHERRSRSNSILKTMGFSESDRKLSIIHSILANNPKLKSKYKLANRISKQSTFLTAGNNETYIPLRHSTTNHNLLDPISNNHSSFNLINSLIPLNNNNNTDDKSTKPFNISNLYKDDSILSFLSHNNSNRKKMLPHITKKSAVKTHTYPIDDNVEMKNYVLKSHNIPIISKIDQSDNTISSENVKNQPSNKMNKNVSYSEIKSHRIDVNDISSSKTSFNIPSISNTHNIYLSPIKNKPDSTFLIPNTLVDSSGGLNQKSLKLSFSSAQLKKPDIILEDAINAKAEKIIKKINGDIEDSDNPMHVVNQKRFILLLPDRIDQKISAKVKTKLHQSRSPGRKLLPKVSS